MSALPAARNSRSAIGAVGFCTVAGQLRVGIGKADTFRRMLEEIHRVTPSAAEAVVRVYPDVRALVAAFAECGEEVLADLPVCVVLLFISAVC
jgi:crossover junction endonuclease EME1